MLAMNNTGEFERWPDLVMGDWAKHRLSQSPLRAKSGPFILLGIFRRISLNAMKQISTLAVQAERRSIAAYV